MRVLSLFHKFTSMNLVASILLPLTVILMEVFWVYPWLILMGRWPAFAEQRLPLGLTSLILLSGGSFIITRFLGSRSWPLRWSRLSIVVISIIALLVTLRLEYPAGSGLFDIRWFARITELVLDSFSHPHPIVVAIAIGPFLWWRGIVWGNSLLLFNDIYRAFLIGLVAQVILILAWGTGPISNLMPTTGLYAAAFFFCGLFALALSRLQGMQGKWQEREGNPLFNIRWLSIIALVIGSIVLVGIGIASIFSTEFLSIFGQIFNLVSGLLFKIIYVVTTVVGFLVAISFYIVQTIINMLQQDPPAEVSSSANVTAIEEIQQGVSRPLPPEAVLVMKWVLLALIIAGVIFLFVRAFLRYSSQREEDIEEIHESLWSWNGFATDLGLFFGSIWQNLRNKVKQVIPEAAVRSRGQRKGIGGRLDIREIYRQLLWQASQMGITRRRYETPYEYGERLGQTIPEGRAPLNKLTDLYLSVRYGDLALQAAQIDDANNLWLTLQNLLRREEENGSE